jgi:single-strand DNA-binding protein
MKDMNKVILLGRLGADPVQRETKNGLAVTSFTLATSRRGKEEGEVQTQWHKVVAWGKQAEACSAYLKKGHSVFIEGTMRTHKYEGKDGNARTAFEVHVDEISFLGTGGKTVKMAPNRSAEVGLEDTPVAASG